jgi:hypothetical protein
MKRTMLFTALALVGSAALIAVGAAAGGASKGKPSLSATPIFKLQLKPSQEVPPIKNLRARARGSVTFDLTRDASGAITAGEVIFSFNYSFPGSVTISGLHIHEAPKGVNGPIRVDSGLASFTDADGKGNVTLTVAGTPAILQAILDKPRNYYVNLHTTTPNHPGGALRQQLHNPKKG